MIDVSASANAMDQVVAICRYVDSFGRWSPPLWLKPLDVLARVQRRSDAIAAHCKLVLGSRPLFIVRDLKLDRFGDDLLEFSFVGRSDDDRLFLYQLMMGPAPYDAEHDTLLISRV